MRLLVSAFLSILLAQAAAAQSPAPRAVDPAELRALAANYELANADGNRKCKITLDQKPAGGAFTLLYDRPECIKLFGFLGEVTAWAPGPAGSIKFVRANGRMVAEFTEGVGGVYEAIREGDAVYFLANLQFVDPKEFAQPADLIGNWNIARPTGTATCQLVFTDQPSDDEGFKLSVQPGCDATLLRFDPASWRLERGDVVLQSKQGERLRFGKQEGGDWAKVPELPTPLVMKRP
ncbi:MAG TPA: protease inhibitor Inh/omp19 family protein [Xanthobacteraceae bacterium]|jgi:hypothetical protein